MEVFMDFHLLVLFDFVFSEYCDKLGDSLENQQIRMELLDQPSRVLCKAREWCDLRGFVSGLDDNWLLYQAKEEY